MKFKITNTTVKPPKLDPKTGKDMRTAIEKVGHSVQFRVGPDQTTARVVRLIQGMSTLVDNLDPGLLNLQRGGFIRIEPIKDIAAALREHSLQQKETKATAKKSAEAKRDDNRKARAVEMGKDTYAQKGGAELEDAVNPDGDPNFLATATSSKGGRKRKAGRNKGQEVDDVSAAGSVGN